MSRSVSQVVLSNSDVRQLEKDVLLMSKLARKDEILVSGPYWPEDLDSAVLEFFADGGTRAWQMAFENKLLHQAEVCDSVTTVISMVTEGETAE